MKQQHLQTTEWKTLHNTKTWVEIRKITYEKNSVIAGPDGKYIETLGCGHESPSWGGIISKLIPSPDYTGNEMMRMCHQKWNEIELPTY